MQAKASFSRIPINVSEVLLFRQGHGVVLSLLHVVALDDDVGAVRLALLYLHDGRDVGHDHGGRYVEQVGVVADGL